MLEIGTLKRNHIDLNPAKDRLELYQGVDRFIERYNRKRHQGIQRQKPTDRYQFAA